MSPFFAAIRVRSPACSGLLALLLGGFRLMACAPDAAAPAPSTPPEKPVPRAADEDPAAPAGPDGREEIVKEPAAPPSFNAAGGHAELNERTRALVWGTAEDDEPEVLDASRADLEGRHYFYSDEENLALFHEHIRDLGGAYMGVGTDQLYLFAGWQRPELAFATDYDPWIRELHRIYLHFFERAGDIDSFIALWSRDNYRESRAILDEEFADHDERQLLLRVFATAHALVHRRMRRIRNMSRAYDIPTFVTDEEMYTFVRGMVLAGRIRPTLSNLLASRGLSGLSAMLREVEVPLRVFYISNAEEYWSYPDQFRKNVAALPFDERGILLRTSAAKRSNGDYRYNIQTAASFQAWVAHPDTRRHTSFYDRPRVRRENHFPFSLTDKFPGSDED